MCDRLLDPTGQNCWGVCLEEDVLSIEDDTGCNAADHPGQPADICNMRDWLIRTITEDVREIEQYFRVPRRAGNLRLTRSAGLYRDLYRENGLPNWADELCATLPFLELPLPLHCLPAPFLGIPLPLHHLSVQFHCLSLFFHCLQVQRTRR